MTGNLPIPVGLSPSPAARLRPLPQVGEVTGNTTWRSHINGTLLVPSYLDLSKSGTRSHAAGNSSDAAPNVCDTTNPLAWDV
jgi:hypothetical protein